MENELGVRVRARVDQGVAFLDERLGLDWPLRVDRPNLRMADVHRCVLGQLFAPSTPADVSTPFLWACQQLWPEAELPQGQCCWACWVNQLTSLLGFDRSSDDGQFGVNAAYAALTAAWRAQIGVLQDERQPDWA